MQNVGFLMTRLVYILYTTNDQVRSSAGSVCCFLEQETFTPQKVLVIPRNRWLRLNMTEKLFTGTLNHNQNKTKQTNDQAVDVPSLSIYSRHHVTELLLHIFLCVLYVMSTCL